MDLIQRAHVSISIPLDDVSGVGEARRRAIELAESLHLPESDIGRIALVVTEAASNVVHHAVRGELLLRGFARSAPASVEVLALDQGPGIANVALAMQDGYSTGGSAGLGLGAIARLATCFEITSTPGKGTALLARVGRVTPVHAGLRWGAVCVSKRGEDLCGDAWAVTRGQDCNTVLMVDGVGHGPAAFDSAQQVVQAFHALAPAAPTADLQALHAALRAQRVTRGAVAAIARLDWRTRQVCYAGAGNIAGTIVPVGGAAACMVSQPGTLGQQVSRFQEFDYPWPDQGLLILHSDGMSDRWQLEPYPGLTRKDPALIAGVLYRDYASRRDDVVVLVGREQGPS